MLRKFNYYDCKSVSTPYDPNIILKKSMRELISQHKYAHLIGSLLYITNRTRPDIAFDVNKLSRHTSNSSTEHWIALGRVFKYLRGIVDYCLLYIGYPDAIEDYTDATGNWLSDVKPISGLVFMLGGAVISWGSD